MVYLIAALMALLVVVLGGAWRLSRGRRAFSVGSRCESTSAGSSTYGTTSAGSREYLRVKDPRVFSGDVNDLREWTFAVELAFRANRIQEGIAQVDFASSFLQGNALLWFLSCLDSGRSFPDWESLKTTLQETFGPLDAEEDSRLAFFSIIQKGGLDEYIREFTRLSLNVSDLDQHSRALLFVRGLSDSLRADAMREHPKTVSEAIRAARTARRNDGLTTRNDRTVRNDPGKRVNETSSQPPKGRREKLSDEERSKLLREGRCFKCRSSGHVARNCPENSPNAPRQ